MPRPQNLQNAIDNGRALLRFAVRVIILAGFATFVSTGFNQNLAILLWMAMAFSAVSALVRREPPLAAILNHWDEMMGYAVLLALLGVLDHSLPA
ncbi:MAG TPA: hypothetical protein VMM15_24950 [Bradyrhizobium sp.]|nr:hypothetical protein [Bradyrhizobium sp.]